MPRIPELNPAEMDTAQKAVYDSILAGPRGSARGPFHAWLHSPELADRAQHLGAFCRYSTSLPPALSELAILVVARHWRSQFEWYAHAPMAFEAGISAAVIEAIRCHQEPDLVEPDQRVVYAFVGQLLRDRTVDQILYDQAVAALWGSAVWSIWWALWVTFCLVSATLNVFDMPLPDGEPEPLGP
ncbi:MAG: hypothetical protein CM1200mP41_05160 [Gammaproteobacteria bacterium]|nr:MAG: hypothetical protein CM1200mP41_05160 [Gammaproteobacteria bacterium]